MAYSFAITTLFVGRRLVCFLIVLVEYYRVLEYSNYQYIFGVCIERTVYSQDNDEIPRLAARRRNIFGFVIKIELPSVLSCGAKVKKSHACVEKGIL